jgi:hypothetical protein
MHLGFRLSFENERTATVSMETNGHKTEYDAAEDAIDLLDERVSRLSKTARTDEVTAKLRKAALMRRAVLQLMLRNEMYDEEHGDVYDDA